MPVRLLAVTAILVVRLVALDADPPPWLSWSTGLYTDEGFYTLDARHEALFGTWAPGNFHDRLLSPLLSVLQQGVFGVLGAGMVPARLLSVVFGLLTVWVFWLGLRRTQGRVVADWGALFLGLALPFALYNRLALQETPTVFWLVLSFTLWACGRISEKVRKRTLLLTLAGAAFGIAVTFKALALLALPAFVWAWWGAAPTRLAGGSSPASQERAVGGWRECAGVGGVLVLYALLWYLPHHAELARMGTYYRTHQYQPHSWLTVWLNIRRGFVGGARGVFPYLLALLPIPCLLAGWGGGRCLTPPELGAGGRSSPPASGPGGAERIFTIWLLCGLAFCLLSTYAPDRYYVLFLPALAGLAARGMTRLRRPLQIAAIALFLVTSGFWYSRAWAERTYARRDAARTLAHLLPPGSVMVGNDAPGLCQDTAIAAAPVQPGLSNDDHPVERLNAGFIAVTRVPMWEAWWRSHYPALVQPSHRLATFTQGGPRHRLVDVYRVKMYLNTSKRE
ncbi:MAG: glycosyltransferase family 39 protein [Armatimonadetes bacterium]|nr:glycosyltransferase family 39 protein [Armatimonadota bacterium]